MYIELNFKSGKPAYLQIIDQVKYASAMGDIKPGEMLPSIRNLAERLRVNRNTVAKAYSQLEHEGLVKTRRGKGFFLTSQISPFTKEMRQKILAASVDEAIVKAFHFQISRDDLVAMINERYDEFEKKRKKEKI